MITIVNTICLCGHRDQHNCRADWATRPTPESDVQGHCPACRGESLFLAASGYITCRRLDCPDPDAASKTLKPKGTA
ncbi:DUF6085 family protein [Streptomyces xanthophaeus]